MAGTNRDKVNIRVHENFFKNIFEPERVKLGMKLNINLTQSAFTNYLAKSGAKIVYPKVRKMPMQRIRRNKVVKMPFSL
jgi:5-formyltetrahydrofolate cyclo-ligase